MATFEAFSLEAQTEAYPQITAAFSMLVKDAYRLELETEIRALGFGRALMRAGRLKPVRP